jgi:glucose/mannose transport system substrate-binding protein
VLALGKNQNLVALGLLLVAWGSAASAAPAPAASLHTLHWWTSASERRAADVLDARLAEEGVAWKDDAIPGGAGVGAGKVLKSRVLAGDAPDAMQLIGISIGEWANAGLLLEIDKVAQADNWRGVLFPAISQLVEHRQHVFGVPLGIHRINSLFYNEKLFRKYKLAPPATWAELAQAARVLRAAGVTPLAQSSEPWQVATLFENLVLAEGGPAYYRALFVAQTAQATADRRLLQALERLRIMKAWTGKPVAERSWTDIVRQVASGEAAMVVMGDWAKGELNEWGLRAGADFGCIAMPGTGNYHLYSVDTLAMFASDYSHMPAQEKLASIAVRPSVQAEYNRLKGSVPVRRDADTARMDSCARASWSTFARGAAQQVPSLSHRMAADEGSREAIIAEIYRYFMDERITPGETQKRLDMILRGFRLRKRGNEGPPSA